jgi:ubiquinone biosynthesis protein COQ4
MQSASALPRLSALRAQLSGLPALRASLGELRTALRSTSAGEFLGPQAAPAPAARPAAPDDIAALPATERWSRALQALARLIANPEQTEEVLVFTSMINGGTASRRLARFYADPRGQMLYAQQRAIDSHTVDLAALAALPDGTLGHAYATFLRSHGLTPDVFDGPPAGIRDPKLAYVMQRMRQTHDLWHVVTGCETDPAGEIALQAFTYAQIRAPGNAVLAAVGTLKGMRVSPGIVRDVVALFRAGVRANRLPTFPWEDHWATPLTEVRALLGLPARPRPRAAA